MRYVPDVLIRDADDRLLAAIEVKGDTTLSRRRAQGIFESLRSASGLAPDYVLVLSPKLGFVWKADVLQADGSPNIEFDFSEVLADYGKQRRRSRREKALEYTVFRWLFDVALGAREPDTHAELVLAEIGFIDAIRDARVAFGLAA